MWRIRLSHCLTLGLTLVAAALFAQPVSVAGDFLLDRWTTADGLPVNGTTAVHIGRSGYLWLATFDGLVRFDGNRFVVFNTGSHPGLPGNRLTTLTETADGDLWLTTEQHALARFDGARFRTFGRDDGLPSSRVLTTYADAEGTLWVGTARGLARWDGERFRAWAPEVVSGAVTAIVAHTGGRIWVGTEAEGLVALQGESLRRRYTPRDGVPASIETLSRDAANGIWIGGGRDLLRLRDGVIERLPHRARRGAGADRETPGERPALAIAEWVRAAPDGAVWTVRQHVLARDGRTVVVAPCLIRGLDFDDTGAAWLATGCDGLWRLRRRQVVALTAEHGLPEGAVYGMAQGPDGTLWATTAGGTMSAIRRRRGEVEVSVYPTTTAGPNVGTLLSDPDGRIWAGQLGLCVFADGRCEEPPGLPSRLRREHVLALFRSDDGGLWVGTLSGLWRHDGESWRPMREALALAPGTSVRTITQATSGNLWFGTGSDGLRRLTAGGEVHRFSRRHGLSSAAARDLYEDAGGRLWVATEDRGLCRSRRPEDAAELRFNCIGTAEGLPSDSLHRILADDAGRLWFNSNQGVFWIERGALERVLDGRAPRVYPRVYTERDGLPDREGNGGVQNAGIRLADGRMAFPGQGGIAIFDPRHIRETPVRPRVVIETLLLPGGHEVRSRSPLTLPRGERVFSVRFTGLTPGLTDPLYFRYRLRPHGSAWTELGDDRLLSFERLAPGRYVLDIAAIDATSGTVGPVTHLRLHLPAFFYETLTFRVAVALALVAAAVLAVWRRQQAAASRRRELEAEVERSTAEAREQQRLAERARGAAEEALATVERQRGEIAAMAEARTRFFGNVSHELRTPLSLLVGPLHDQAAGTPAPEPLVAAMLRNARRLERLVEQLLDLERLDAREDARRLGLLLVGAALAAPLGERRLDLRCLLVGRLGIGERARAAQAGGDHGD